MLKILKDISGTILAEALVAIATLTGGIIVVGTIINNAIPTTIVSRDYFIVQNLLDEQIEALNSIVATNWMNFPDDKSCWLVKDKSTCSDSSKVTVGSTYTTIFEENNWKLLLSNNCSATNLTTIEECNLSLKNIALSDGTTFQQYVPYEAGLDKSKFYRSIKAIDISSDQSRAVFEIRLQWNDGSKLREIKELITLYNYIK